MTRRRCGDDRATSKWVVPPALPDMLLDLGARVRVWKKNSPFSFALLAFGSQVNPKSNLHARSALIPLIEI